MYKLIRSVVFVILLSWANTYAFSLPLGEKNEVHNISKNDITKISTVIFRITESSAYNYGASTIILDNADEIYDCIVNIKVEKILLENCKKYFLDEYGRFIRPNFYTPINDAAWLNLFNGFKDSYEYYLERIKNSNESNNIPNPTQKIESVREFRAKN